MKRVRKESSGSDTVFEPEFATGPYRAKLRPAPKTEQPRRKPGALRGLIWMASDFDTLSPDVLAAMESEED